jgi:two-component system cell cycle sensor histidine kinase/response regulator CckA
MLNATRSAKILITEDELVVADDLRMALKGMGYDVTGIAATATEAIHLTSETSPQLVLMDIKLRGDRDGIYAAKEIRRHYDVPVVFLTAHADTETLDRAAQSLPFGYLVKPYAEFELRAEIEMALRLHQSQSQVAQLERFLSATLGALSEGVLAVDLSARITYLNRAAERVTGWSIEEARGKPWQSVYQVRYADPDSEVSDPIVRIMVDQAPGKLPTRAVLATRLKGEVAIEDFAAPIVDPNGSLTGAVITFRDCTEQRGLEAEKQRLAEKLLHAQKLESLGLLAGGFAHDFNNILAAIMPYAEFLQDSFDEPAPEKAYAQHITEAGCRGAELCQQILSYAGQGPKRTEDFDLNKIVQETVSLLKASISKKAALHVMLKSGLPLMRGDPSQVRQIVMNLVINASDALAGKEGTVSLKTDLFSADRAWLERAVFATDRAPGDYLLLEVRDTGCGMSPATLAKIFDPFFTTKSFGRGLGLAAVHGIIRDYQGALRVQSQENMGTIFSILFPAYQGKPAAEERPLTILQEWCGEGEVLVVDDDPLVRNALALILSHLGFTPIHASDGPHALNVVENLGAVLKFALVDFCMPHMDGVETCQRMRTLSPRMPVVLMSGFGETINTNVGQLEVAGILRKPFTIDTLKSVVQHALQGL